MKMLAGCWIDPRFVRKRSDSAPSLVDQVRRDERHEQHALGADEGPDRDLATVEAGGRVVMRNRMRGGWCSHDLVVLRFERCAQPGIQTTDENRRSDENQHACGHQSREHRDQSKRDDQRLDRAVWNWNSQFFGALSFLSVDTRALTIE